MPNRVDHHAGVGKNDPMTPRWRECVAGARSERTKHTNCLRVNRRGDQGTRYQKFIKYRKNGFVREQ